MESCKEREQHGMRNDCLYNAWAAMRYRCQNPNNSAYKYYGARGITVCSEWNQSFKTFHKFAISHGYKQGLTIERINVNGNYEPNNVTFIPSSMQTNNRRNSTRITIDGTTHTLSDWAREHGLARDCIRSRIKKGKKGRDLIEPARIPKHPAIPNLSLISGISKNVIRSRIRRGWDKENLVLPLKNIKRYATINGIKRTFIEWCKIIGISRHALQYRLEQGWKDADLFLPPQR